MGWDIFGSNANERMDRWDGISFIRRFGCVVVRSCGVFILFSSLRTREEVEDEPTASTAGAPGAPPTTTAAATTSKHERCTLEAGIEVGIQPGSYKLVYRDGTADAFVVLRGGEGGSEDEEKEEQRQRARKEERVRRVDSWVERIREGKGEEEVIDEE